MLIGARRSSFLLFVGDLVAFFLALYLTLSVRHWALPSAATLAPYWVPFSLLFALWALIFYSAGLYGKRLALFPSRQPAALLSTQSVNILLAAVFFFVIPAFGIAPKTILALYLVVSLALVYLWRLALYPRVSMRSTRERVALIARGGEAEELFAEVNGNPRYGIQFVLILDRERAHSSALATAIEKADPTLLVVDTQLPEAGDLMPLIYDLTRAQRRYQFASFEDIYEEVFDRIPLSQLEHAWFLEHAATNASAGYSATKRAIDLVGGVFMAVIVVVATPFVFIANVLTGNRGPLFIAQDRFGRYGKLVKSYKFRSMRVNKSASPEWTVEEKQDNPVTAVGGFLRKTSLDEFPQCINILSGDLSLVGPRNDILGLGKRLALALPYYEARYLVEPGITGWAQINQRYEPGNASPQSVEETKVRLAYDFYYLKHRSLALDFVIMLKTIKRMFFRVSSW